ncbi:MAG: fibronectin type III domain-containing protein [Candidatus Riflebacteria bacterium]|nr:fibronectin type III domain-containing protein [Candidatus Riflebacteria bacterium]
MKKNIVIAILMLFTAVINLVGCSSSSDNSLNAESGTVTGSLLDAANSNIVATSDSGEYLIPVGADGRFSANLPVGVYSLSYRSAAANNKLVLTEKKLVVANNVTISVVDAELVPIPQVLSVTVPVINANSAIIEWETDIESDGYLEYGTNELYGVSTYVSTDLTTHHRVQLGSLSANTTYHFRIVASRHNLESSRFYSQDYTFTTP